MAGEREEFGSLQLWPRKVRVGRELYLRLQWAAEQYQVAGGVSAVVRRAVRWHLRVRELGRCDWADTEPAGRDASTVLTVFLEEDQARWLDEAAASVVRGVLAAYLDLPRPAPPAPFRPPVEEGVGYVVAEMEA